MKEFNLEHALAGAPVVTRNGRKVKEIHYFKYAIEKYPLRAVIDKEIIGFDIKGFWGSGEMPKDQDLFMAPAFALNDKEYYFDDVVMLNGKRTVVNAETLPEIKTALMYPDLVKPVARKKMWAQMYIDEGKVYVRTWRADELCPPFPKVVIWLGDPVSYEVEE